jgi:tetratricopeptide (TPR) repeat protein
MNIHAPACKTLHADLNAFVDGELETADMARIAKHTQSCDGCADYLETLRKLSQLHRRSAELLDGMEATIEDETLTPLDTSALVGRLLGQASDDEWTTLSRLFYELGKAYVLEGNRRLPRTQSRSVTVRKAPADIRRSEARARSRLAKIDRLDEAGAGEGDRRGELFRRRSRRLMAMSGSASSGALLKGRRFLEECLALDSSHDEARLYLGFALLVSGRADRARAEFRRVNREAAEPTIQLMAMQWLGNLAVNTSRLDEAVRCYEEVVTSGAATNEPRLFSSFLNLPVTLAKLGRWEEAVSHFSTLVQRFPERLAQVREMLEGMGAFRRLLDENQPMQRTLHDRVPGLFAAA